MHRKRRRRKSMLNVEIGYPDNPSDNAPLKDWLGRLPKDRIAKLIVLGKTEGPATLNDFSRDLAQMTTDAAIAEIGGVDLLAKSFNLFSTGCEGIATPLTVMIAETRETDTKSAVTGLALGTARSEPLAADARCGLPHVDAAADAVARAMADGKLQKEQVSLVLIKSPILIPGPRASGRHAGSTGSSRGAAAIGAGIALGMIDRARLSEDPVGRDEVFASRVMAFSGIETDRVEAVVIGKRPGGDPQWGVSDFALIDLMDSEGIAALKTQIADKPAVVFFKAAISPDGRLRGRRTTILTSDLTADKHLRAAASGIIASHFGTASAFISGGAEHQSPPGGCLGAVLYRRTLPK